MEIEIETIKLKKMNPRKVLGIMVIFFIAFLLVFFGIRAYNLTRHIIVAKSSSASPYLSGGLDFISENQVCQKNHSSDKTSRNNISNYFFVDGYR